jgi:glycosyltransferase 2 family protein
MPDAVGSKRRHTWLRLAGTAIALGVVAFLVYQNWDDFVQGFKSLPLHYLLMALGLALVSRTAVTLRWFVLLKAAHPAVSLWRVFQLSFVGLFSTNVMPSTIGGDVVKLAGAKKIGMDSAHVAASLLVDRLTGMVTMATFLPLGLWQMFHAAPESFALEMASAGTFLSGLWKRLWTFFGKTWHSLQIWFKQPLILLAAALLSYIHMACTFSMVYVILLGLGDPVGWWAVGGLWVLIYFITLVPISINGLGLQEASLSLIYVNFAGTAESSSLVLALWMRLLFVMASLPGAVFMPAVMADKKSDSLKTYLEDSPNREDV